jgi:hypothetical protein
MTKIEDKLWAELTQEPEAPFALAVHPRARRPRRPLAAAALLGIVAAVAAAVALAANRGATPAYAVNLTNDGAVSLTLNEITGVSGANKQLAKLGTRVVIARVEPGCSATAQPVPIPPSTMSQQDPMVEPEKRGEGMSGLTWVIRPSLIPAGDTVVIAVQPANDGKPIAMSNGRPVSALSGTIGLYRGNAPACRPPIESTSGAGA